MPGGREMEKYDVFELKMILLSILITLITIVSGIILACVIA